MKFSQEPPAGSPFAAREWFVEKDAQTLAREILAMEPVDYATAFKGSAMKWAKLWMLERNACVEVRHVGTADDVSEHPTHSCCARPQ